MDGSLVEGPDDRFK